MEDLNFQIEKIAGHAGDNAECGVVNKKISLTDGEVGNLACCLLVYDSDNAHRQDAIRDILEIVERRFEGAEGSMLDVLKGAVESSGAYLQEQGVNASFLIAFFYKNVCYIAKYGDKVRLVIFEETKKSELDFEFGSGPVSAGQTYLIATDKFLELFSEGTFRREEIDLSEVIDGLATEISAKVDQAEIGAVFVSVKESDVKTGEEPLESEGERLVESVEEPVVAAENIEVEEGDLGGVEEANQSEDQKNANGDKQPRRDFVSLTIGRFFRELGRIRTGDGSAILRLRRNILIIAILIVVGLGGFAGYTIFQKNEIAKQQEVKSYLDSARSKLNEGTAIIELNKTRAREILIDAQKQAQKAREIDSTNPEVSKVISEIESKMAETEQTTSLNFSTFSEVESDLQSLAFNGSRVEAFGQDKIFEIDSSGKVVQEYDGISGVESGVVFDNKAFVLSDEGVQRLDFSSGKIEAITDSTQAQDIGVFFGNVYLLGDDQITKFVPIEGGYSEPRDYLEKQEEFGGSSRMAIDSLVWVTKGNRILKFNRGVLENFEISGLPGGGGDFNLIFTDSAFANIYVVDSTNSVLLVIDKKGEYKRALSSEEFGKASDILVNDSEDKLYLSVGSKILSTGLGK